MGKVKAVPQFSESISSFCKLMENAQRDYAWNYDEVNRMDRLTQDYLRNRQSRQRLDRHGTIVVGSCETFHHYNVQGVK